MAIRDFMIFKCRNGANPFAANVLLYAHRSPRNETFPHEIQSLRSLHVSFRRVKSQPQTRFIQFPTVGFQLLSTISLSLTGQEIQTKNHCVPTHTHITHLLSRIKLRWCESVLPYQLLRFSRSERKYTRNYALDTHCFAFQLTDPKDLEFTVYLTRRTHVIIMRCPFDRVVDMAN